MEGVVYAAYCISVLAPLPALYQDSALLPWPMPKAQYYENLGVLSWGLPREGKKLKTHSFL